MIAERSTYHFHNTTETEPGWLSPSSITSYLSCPACFYLSRIRKLPKPLSINLPLGSGLHKAIEKARLGATREEAIQAAVDHFDAECAQPVDEETGEPIDAEIDLGSKYDSLGAAKDQVVALAEFTVPKILALDAKRGKIAAVEMTLSMLNVNPYPFRIDGRIDVAYVDFLADASKPELATLSADLKSAGRQEPPSELTAIAQTIYREHWTARGLPLQIMVDVVDKTQHPRLVSYPLMVDEFAEQLTHQTVLEVADGISAGRFPPHPSYLCDFVHGYGEFVMPARGFDE